MRYGVIVVYGDIVIDVVFVLVGTKCVDCIMFFMGDDFVNLDVVLCIDCDIFVFIFYIVIYVVDFWIFCLFECIFLV